MYWSTPGVLDNWLSYELEKVLGTQPHPLCDYLHFLSLAFGYLGIYYVKG